jgi:PAS domain S-box-containing protein
MSLLVPSVADRSSLALDDSLPAQLRLLQAAVAHLNDIVVVTSAETLDAPGPTIVYVNPAFERVTGYAAAEVIGRSPRLLQGPGTDRATLDRVRAALVRGEGIRVELLNYAKDGTSYWLEMDIAPVHDGEGRITHHVAIERDVTERKRAELALRTSEAFAHTLLDNSPDCVKLLGLDGRLQAMNRPGCRLMEVDDVAAVIGADWAGVWPGELSATARAAVAAARAGREEQFQGFCPTLKGTPKWWDVRVVPVHDGAGAITSLLSVSRDITAMKRAELALRERETRYRSVVEAAGSVIVGICPDHTIFEWNRAAERLFGIARGDALGTDYVARFLPEEHRDAVAADLCAVLAGGATERMENAVLLPDGTRRTLSWNVTRLGGTGDTAVGVVAIGQDVTDQRALEEQLRQAQRMEAMGRLAGGVAHDFNNILTAIRGNAEFLAGALPAGGTLARDAEEIRDAADRAAGLTRQLLAFSRRQVLQPRVVDLNVVVAGVERLLARVLGEHVRLTVRPAPTPQWVHADPGQLDQVLINLAVNARDAMPDGGPLEIAVVPEAARGTGRVVVRVSDRGTGMDATTRTRAFEPFFTTKPVGRGTGLGLATVHGIVEQAGGAAWIDSALGHGTTVSVALPRVHGPRGVTAPGPARPAAGHGRVLLVEDEAMVRALTERILVRAGYRVATARNGREALARLEAQGPGEAPIDVLVTDVVMPEMGGRELAQRLRRARPDLPVVFMSGYVDDGLAASDLERRSAFVEKPFTGDALVARILALQEA